MELMLLLSKYIMSFVFIWFLAALCLGVSLCSSLVKLEIQVKCSKLYFNLSDSGFSFVSNVFLHVLGMAMLIVYYQINCSTSCPREAIFGLAGLDSGVTGRLVKMEKSSQHSTVQGTSQSLYPTLFSSPTFWYCCKSMWPSLWTVVLITFLWMKPSRGTMVQI